MRTNAAAMNDNLKICKSTGKNEMPIGIGILPCLLPVSTNRVKALQGINNLCYNLSIAAFLRILRFGTHCKYMVLKGKTGMGIYIFLKCIILGGSILTIN